MTQFPLVYSMLFHRDCDSLRQDFLSLLVTPCYCGNLEKSKMGGSPSRPENCKHGCWSFRTRIDNDDSYMKKAGGKRPKRLKKLRLELDSASGQRWNDIPTPSICEGPEYDLPPQPPTQEKLLQMIHCFPFPTPRNTPQASPKLTCKIGDEALQIDESHPRSDSNAFNSAFEKLVQVSVETMAITALPMDVWLKERLKKWVQLSGHEGSIVPASCQTLYKKQNGNCNEARAYEGIMKDPMLAGCTPRYYRELQKNEESFIEIEDLLQQFPDPTNVNIMDIKIGTRTFLESEVANTKRRSDLYEKMVTIDPNEPTEEERQRKEITKLRYMQFRERESSSAQLGFRIEAAKMPGGTLQKNFKKVKTADDVTATLLAFFGSNPQAVHSQLLRRIVAMREAVEKSSFFSTHEVVGSSMLIVHDEEKVGCWMIDFAKSHPVETGRKMNHRTSWKPGNNEDGYLFGVDNLVEILEKISFTNSEIGVRR